MLAWVKSMPAGTRTLNPSEALAGVSGKVFGLGFNHEVFVVEAARVLWQRCDIS